MEFPKLEKRVIIAMKGLPFTVKTEVAKLLSNWLRCPYYCIDDLIGDYDEDDHRSREAAERIQQKAFSMMCKMARRNLQDICSAFGCVIIKSRLCSEFELEKLIELANSSNVYRIVVIECKVRKKRQWQNLAESCISCSDPSTYSAESRKNLSPRAWHKSRSWNEVKKANLEYDDQAWEHHLFKYLVELVQSKNPVYVTRMVLDPLKNLRLSGNPSIINKLIPDFKNAIKYLLNTTIEREKSYEVVEYDDLRRYLLDDQIRASSWRNRRKTLCEGGGCVFKYWQEFGDDANCGVCQEQVVSSAYTCYFCILTLHKACAEKVVDSEQLLMLDDRYEHSSYLSYLKLQEKHTCKSCSEFTKDCECCLYTTHLKCGLAPTIVKHESHPHHLSIRHLNKNSAGQLYNCNACGESVGWNFSYGCKICDRYFHIGCVFWPSELEHRHGGYKHRIKLMFSHNDGIEEDDNWCDSCHVDLDSDLWFYSCQECNYYVTHVKCSRASLPSYLRQHYD